MTQAARYLKYVTTRPGFVLEIEFTNGDQGHLHLTKHLLLTGYFAPLA